MTTRIAPEGGYDFEEKKQYRRNIWAQFKRSPYWHRNAKAIVMPSLEGSELEVVISKGLRQENLHIIDRNPAIVATLKRKYPNINTYGVEVAKAVGRIKEDIDFANLDLCSSLGEPLRVTLSEFGMHQVMGQGLVSITFLRGREHGSFSEIADCFADRDEMRASVIALWLRAYSRLEHDDGTTLILPANVVFHERGETYKSTAGNQTMRWEMFIIHRQPCTCADCASWYFEMVDWSVDEWLKTLVKYSAVDTTEEALDWGIKTSMKLMRKKHKRPNHKQYMNLLQHLRRELKGQEHDFSGVLDLT